LGALGILVEITIQCEEAFYLQRQTTGGLQVPTVFSNIQQYLSHDYASFWWNADKNEFVAFTFDKVTQPARLPNEYVMKVMQIILGFTMNNMMWIGAKLPLLNAFVMSTLYESMKSQKNVIDRGYRTISFTKEMLDWSPKFSECEYFIDQERAQEVLTSLREFFKKGGYVFNFPISVRFSKADSTWLSPDYNRPSVIISMAMVYKTKALMQFSKELDVFMKQFEGRPHWGKNHNLKAQDLKKLYPKLDEFEQLRRTMDPQGVFLNSYLKDCLIE